MKKQQLILRLDDAAERMDVDKWQSIEKMLDKYNIKPLVGVIPDCKDPMMSNYGFDPDFWIKVHKWEEKGWIIAMHGYTHVYDSKDGGINPVNNKSEFSGHSLDEQRKRIKKAYLIFKMHKLSPKVFFAPSHTFDLNTLKALEMETDIRIISDTIARDVYSAYGFTMLPQQSGRVRCLPFRTVTFCYHPNTMSDEDFESLERYLQKKKEKFVIDVNALDSKRRYDLFDKVLKSSYFFMKKNRKRI